MSVVKIFAFIGLKQNWIFFKGLFKLTQISIERKQNADNYKKVRSIERKAQYKKKKFIQ